MRDEFSSDVKMNLAKRVGVRCSNPICRKSTSGPRDDPNKSINIGVAAHITAASSDGPRYDPNMSSEQRSSIENGIWLCQNCAKLIDNDPERFTVGILFQWKNLSEELARLDIESITHRSSRVSTSDIDFLLFYSQCFDRPAFQDPFRQEGSLQGFDKAIEDTITAINTGCLRARDGTVLSQAKGKSFLENYKWHEHMDVIVDLLRAIRSQYAIGVKYQKIRESTMNNSYYVDDPKLCDWMDNTRKQILDIFGEICKEAGITASSFPRKIPIVLHRERIDIFSIIETIVKDLEPISQAIGNEIKIIWNNKQPVNIIADSAQLSQALDILLRFSLYFLSTFSFGKQRTIELMQEEDSQIVLRIAFRGRVASTYERERIFRSNIAFTPKEEDDIWIAKDIIEAHGGSLFYNISSDSKTHEIHIILPKN
jgi:hypothetical protein